MVFLVLSLLLALVGHGFIWVGAINRLHAVSMPRRICKEFTAVLLLLAGGIPLLILWRPGSAATSVYGGLCLVAGICAIGQWTWRRFFDRARSHERYRRVVAIEKLSSPPANFQHADEHSLLAQLPGNGILGLEEIDCGLEIPRLPPALDGFSILQISDIHFTGRIGKSYFVELADRCNLRGADLVVITGDLIDEEDCFSWISDTWGRLRAPLGVYYIFGNHERRINAGAFRNVLCENGLMDLGSRWVEIAARGQRIVLAGNEVPWFRPAADLRQAPPPPSRGGPVRIALCHSPDQLGWARRNEVDLMLSGHTHGGQWRLPGIGPIFSPTLRGVRYAYGTFYVPPTVMHVSKGVSSDLPYRFRCSPEAVKLTLHAAG